MPLFLKGTKQMKDLIAMLVVFIIATIPIYAGLDQLTVRAVYLTPTDMTEPLEKEISLKRNILIDTQRFYGKEMNKRGYGHKTFNLEKDDNDKVVIHKVKGARTLKQYGNLDLIRDEVNAAFGNPFNIGAENTIWIVFLTGAEKIKNGAHNLQQCTLWSQGNKLIDRVCVDHSLIPVNRNTLITHFTAHELGHAFGLNHNEDGELFLMKPTVEDNPSADLDIVFLSDDECRWLDAHQYFNDRPRNDSIAVVTDAHKWELGTGFIQIVFTVRNNHKLHHSYLQRGGGDRDFVLGWGKLSDDKLSTEFLIHRREFLKKDKVNLHLIDVQGNILKQDFNINFDEVPAAPFKPKVKTAIIWAELK